MATISTKYDQGDRVKTKLGGIEGMITAIFLRDKGVTYEFSYNNNGVPTNTSVQEVEIELSDKNGKIGFKS